LPAQGNPHLPVVPFRHAALPGPRWRGILAWAPACTMLWVDITTRVLHLLPDFARKHLLKRHELIKFLMVGGFCWVLTAIINCTYSEVL
jgi:hypothetical protein